MNLIKKSFLAGIMISIGGIVFLSQENKLVGSVLFTIGLFSIVFFELSLYTGKIGNINKNNYKDLIITIIFNLLGTILVGSILIYTHPKLSEIASNIIKTKIDTSFFTTFINSVGCGILMYIAVTSYKNKKNAIISIALPVIVFINCGFDHCIANAFYWAIGQFNIKYIPNLLICILGNSIGSILFKYLSINRKNIS